MVDTALLLATYNAADHLEELLESLLSQTDSGFTVYFHDDGSNDATVSVMERYISSYPGRFVSIPGPPTGSAKANFLYMLSQVEADCYLFCDDDDVWRPEKVEKERRALRGIEEDDSQHPVPAAVFCDLCVTDERLAVISPTFFSYVDRSPDRTALSQLLVENMAPGCSMMINRPLRDLAISLDDLSLIDMHDSWIMALAAAVGRIAYVDEPLVLYRQTGANEVGAVHEGLSGKLKRNLNNIISGEAKKNKQAFHKQAYDLASALLKVLKSAQVTDLPGDDTGICSSARDATAFLEAFIGTGHSSKLSRIRFYREHGIDKNSGNLWYYLWL